MYLVNHKIELLEICSNLNQIILDYNCFEEDFYRKKLKLGNAVREPLFLYVKGGKMLICTDVRTTNYFS